MEMLQGVLIALLFGLSIAFAYRWDKARRFDLKVKRLTNKIINDILVNSKSKEDKELEEYLDKYNYFMRCLYKYNFFSYWFSFKKLKLHEWFDRRFIDEVNKKKVKPVIEDTEGIYYMYNKMDNL